MTEQQEDLSVNLAIRVAPSMLAALREEALAQDRSVNWLVRKAIDQMLSPPKTRLDRVVEVMERDA